MISETQEIISLNRVIIEATNLCNLDCSICLRQSWSGGLGIMSEEVYSKLVAELGELPSPPDVIFGGYGEPLSHPNILEMIRQLAYVGCQTSLITNGTLLTPYLTRSLVEAGLGKLWISVDSFHQQAIRSASTELTHIGIMAQLAEILRSVNGKLKEMDPGLSMVLARENQATLLAIIDQAKKLGIRSFFITNLEAYSPAQANELPYTLGQLRQPGSWLNAKSELTDMLETMQVSDPGLSIIGTLTNSSSICPFAEQGDLVLRWDGKISPCLPLLYDRTTYIGSWEHKQLSYSLGNILNRSLMEIWTDHDHSRLRERLLGCDYSPCLSCRDCWLSEDNLQDCMGFEHPSCGGCLWAAGLISCP